MNSASLSWDGEGRRGRGTSSGGALYEVWSAQGGSFHHGGYWVVVDSPSNSGDSANAWCDAEDLPADGCYAKRPTTSGGFAGNTIPRG